MLGELLADEVLLVDKVFTKDVLLKGFLRHTFRSLVERTPNSSDAAVTFAQLMLNIFNVDSNEVA